MHRRGYGVVKIRRVQIFAHRIAFAISENKDPGNMLVCHHCDNPTCVKPGHLFLGTQKDNMQDCKRKGRLVVPSPSLNRRERTRCPSGHQYTMGSFYRRKEDGVKVCKVCRNSWYRKRHEKTRTN